MKMKNLKTIRSIMLMAAVSLMITSCADNKKGNTQEAANSEMKNTDEKVELISHNGDAKKVISDYMVLKDALVATDETAAAEAGKVFENTLSNFKLTKYT